MQVQSILDAYAEAERRWPLSGFVPDGMYYNHLRMQNAFIDGARWVLEQEEN